MSEPPILPSLLASLSSLVDVSADPIAIFDRALRHVYVNDAVCALMNRSASELIGARYDEIGISTSNATRMREALANAFSTGLPQRIEVRTLRIGSNVTVFDILYHPCPGPSGDIEFVGAVSRDISALRLAEEDARQTAERLEFLIDAVGVAVLGLDSDLRVHFSNQVAKDELVALGVDDLSASLRPHPLLAEHPVIASTLDAILTTGGSATHEFTTVISGRPRRFQVSIRPEHAADNLIEGCLIIARDVTAERQLQSQLHISERLASLGRIAAGVAHEISNPLTAVHGNLELASNALRDLARTDPALTDRLADVLDMLEESRDGSERIRTIVDDIGLLARDGDLTTGRVALEDVVRTVLQMLGAAIRREARLDLDLGHVGLISGSAPRLVQVLSALVQNALQAMPRGRDLAHNRIAITLAQVDREIRLAVTDNGVGFPTEDRERVFDPFYTTRPVGEGVGLGLTIAHDIVIQHGGHIILESSPGRGTVATVHLPIAED
jgi:two-component system NtrC family sensor kinase